ncbi:baeRF2 domain-containing protein [Streptomyces sp. JNUCC 63]
MELTFLDPVYAQPGPYACAYLDTSRDIPDPEAAINLRRRHLREHLARKGADDATVAAVAGVAGTDQEIAGRHGQAIFASHGRLALVEELPDPPAHDAARFGALPDVMPLAVQHAPDIPYAAATVHRVTHPEAGEPEELQVDFQTGRWPSSAVTPGRCHHRSGPAAEWPYAATEIAGELAELAHRGGAEAIVLGGEVWARNVLVNRLPEPLRERVVTVAGNGHVAGDGEGRALLEQELSEVFRGRMRARDQAQVETFRARRARHTGAGEGMVAVVAALQRAQASGLLLNTPVDPPVRLWAGSEPTQIALSGADLESFGVLGFQEEPPGAALIRALVRTGAELVVVEREELPLEDGVGVLLRYTDHTDPGAPA